MTAPAYDVIAIGNAIVDVMAPCDDATIERLGMTRGGMTLVDTDRALYLYRALGTAVEMSGGSAANTMAGLASLGRRAGFVGKVKSDMARSRAAADTGFPVCSRARCPACPRRPCHGD